MIELAGIGYEYAAGVPALVDLDLAVREGEKVVLLGSNGCGKTTLLKIVDGLLFPSNGTYRYEGMEVTRQALRSGPFQRRFRREVGHLFQNPDAMLFNATVLDEISFGPRQLGLADGEERARSWAERFGLADRLDRLPFELSAGEKKRVCLASLLVLEPRLLLLDEPTSHLDPRSAAMLVELLQETPATVLVSTHTLSLAEELGERAVVLSEDHRAIHDGPTSRIRENRGLLIRANLIHLHSHRHGPREHRHYHEHDWD